jgi:hypothetical protein
MSHLTRQCVHPFRMGRKLRQRSGRIAETGGNLCRQRAIT